MCVVSLFRRNCRQPLANPQKRSEEQSPEEISDAEEDQDNHRDYSRDDAHHGEQLRACFPIHAAMVSQQAVANPRNQVVGARYQHQPLALTGQLPCPTQTLTRIGHSLGPARPYRV